MLLAGRPPSLTIGNVLFLMSLHKATSTMKSENQKRLMVESKNSAQVDPRRVNQTGQRHDVLCRPSNLAAIFHDLSQLRQGKYEEKGKKTGRWKREGEGVHIVFRWLDSAAG